MNTSFWSWRVWCTPVVKRQVSNRRWTTHFLVLEVLADERQNGGGEKTIALWKTFKRVGTGKVNHEIDL